MEAIASNDIHRVRQLIQIALKQGRSIRIILERIEQAIHHVYEARGYTDLDFDLHLYIMNLAGRKGQFVLSKAIGGPSEATIRRRTRPATIHPCLAEPTPVEISANIQSCLADALSTTDPEPVGWTIMLDGITIRRRLRRLKKNRQNFMVGCAREDAEGLCLEMKNPEAILAVINAIFGDSPTCQLGREATVVAVAPFRKTVYHAVAIMASATCKTEKAESFAHVLRMIMTLFTELCSRLGPLWVISSDEQG